MRNKSSKRKHSRKRISSALRSAGEAVLASPRTPKAATKNGADAPAKSSKPQLVSSDPSSPIEVDLRRAKKLEKVIQGEVKRIKKAPPSKRNDPLRLKNRKDRIYPADTLGFQRAIGDRDILQITFLHRAIEAARSVCRIRVRGEVPGPAAFGTGFLVAPGVLLTNHHVLDTPDTANLSLAEFDAELNLNFVHRELRVFNLLPDKLFVTDPSLDFTFVAVNSVAHDGTPLTSFHWLTLMRETGKALNGEWATIIQHPGGESKQIVIRDNRIIILPEPYKDLIGEDFLHYTSDTERGSSGSPVLNDQFEVLALYHKGVPKYDALGRPSARKGGVWEASMGEDEMEWVANEGVRVSAIFRRLDRLAHSDPHAVNLLGLLEDGAPRSIFSALGAGRPAAAEEVGEGPELERTALARRKGKGYDPNFLRFGVPLPKLSKELQKAVQPLDKGPRTDSDGELVYTHFSVVMHAKRRLAIYAAVNIDGGKLGRPRITPRWRPEGRIPPSAQSLKELYAGNKLDKGHLVRRLDPAWGTPLEIDDAVTDTYHYVNAAPQEHSFNDGIWGDVEDYILGIAGEMDHKISVFTGPVFDKKDLEYRGNKPGGPWLIPSQFWKVIVYEKADGTKAATGFLLDQADRIVNLEESLTPLPRARAQAKVSQRTVVDIEKLTGLDFGALRKFDPLMTLEATKRDRTIIMASQVVL